MFRMLNFIKRIWLYLYCSFRKEQIVITRATLSGNGSIIDVRYWLSRPDRIDPRDKFYLVQPETGLRLEVMDLAKFSPVRTRHTGLVDTGVVLFRNSNYLIIPGSKVRVILGKLQSDHVEIK